MYCQTGQRQLVVDAAGSSEATSGVLLRSVCPGEGKEEAFIYQQVRKGPFLVKGGLVGT